MKRGFIFGAIFILLVVVAILVTVFIFKDDEVLTDAVRFKEEYEELNGKKTEDGDAYLELNIDEDNKVQYVNTEEVLEILEDGTGIIYFGFPECPWCRNLVPVLLQVAEDNNYDNIYYSDCYDERDTRHLDEEGNVVTDQEGSDNYYKILDALHDYLSPYEGLEDDNYKRLYFPTVVFVKEGAVVAFHEGTVESQEDPYIPLNEEQESELETILIDGLNKIQDNMCYSDGKC